MVHACSSRIGPWSPPCFPFPILPGSWRLGIRPQHQSRDYYHHSYCHLHCVVHLHDVCTSSIPSIAIPEFILWPHLVHNPDVLGQEISRPGWGNEVCQWKPGTGTDATCDGRDER